MNQNSEVKNIKNQLILFVITNIVFYIIMKKHEYSLLCVLSRSMQVY